MYNPLLDTFIAVVEAGSFSKASEKLFISPTAVMKQMNALEDHLGIILVNRTQTGVSLTTASKEIYQGAQFMIEYSNKTISAAKDTAKNVETTFCVGTSLLNPAKPFMDIWYQLNASFPNYKLHLIPFEDDNTNILSEIKKLGEKFDFLIGVCDSRQWLRTCNFLPLGRYKKMVAVNRDHPLAKKEKLQISNLYGQTLMMVKEGDSSVNDFLRNELTTNHPQITIEDTPTFYDLSVFNRCAETDNVLLSIECWQDVHPGLISIPVEWDYSIPYGILYSNTPSPDVLQFIELVKEFSQTKTHES